MHLLIPTAAAVNAGIVRLGVTHFGGTKLLIAVMGIGSAIGIAPCAKNPFRCNLMV